MDWRRSTVLGIGVTELTCHNFLALKHPGMPYLPCIKHGTHATGHNMAAADEDVILQVDRLMHSMFNGIALDQQLEPGRVTDAYMQHVKMDLMSRTDDITSKIHEKFEGNVAEEYGLMKLALDTWSMRYILYSQSMGLNQIKQELLYAVTMHILQTLNTICSLTAGGEDVEMGDESGETRKRRSGYDDGGRIHPMDRTKCCLCGCMVHGSGIYA